MAGSFNHIIDDQGRLIEPLSMADMLDTGGDVYEAIREMYGMIWWLAEQNTMGGPVLKGDVMWTKQDWVNAAESKATRGLDASPSAGRA